MLHEFQCLIFTVVPIIYYLKQTKNHCRTKTCQQNICTHISIPGAVWESITYMYQENLKFELYCSHLNVRQLFQKQDPFLVVETSRNLNIKAFGAMSRFGMQLHSNVHRHDCKTSTVAEKM